MILPGRESIFSRKDLLVSGFATQVCVPPSSPAVTLVFSPVRTKRSSDCFSGCGEQYYSCARKCKCQRELWPLAHCAPLSSEISMRELLWLAIYDSVSIADRFFFSLSSVCKYCNLFFWPGFPRKVCVDGRPLFLHRQKILYRERNQHFPFLIGFIFTCLKKQDYSEGKPPFPILVEAREEAILG